jgi:hypothetical protein
MERDGPLQVVNQDCILGDSILGLENEAPGRLVYSDGSKHSHSKMTIRRIKTAATPGRMYSMYPKKKVVPPPCRMSSSFEEFLV